MLTNNYPRCKCPNARETVPPGSIICQHCNHSLFPGDAEIAAARVLVYGVVTDFENWLLTMPVKSNNRISKKEIV